MKDGVFIVLRKNKNQHLQTKIYTKFHMQEDFLRVHKLISEGAPVSIDTRQIKDNAVFFALKGQNFDANQFARQAIDKGAAIAVVDDPDLPDSNDFIKVENVLDYLQQLASYHRSLFQIPVIGITGSNGKTTTKELINAVLSRKFETHCTQGNLNNHIGVPLTLLGLHKKHQIAIVEMGANHMGEIAMLSEMAKPTHGIITNIGKAHIEGFGSFENIIRGKTELYQFLTKNKGTVFLNGDNEILSRAASGLQCITYGTNKNNTYTGFPVGSDPFLSIKYKLPEESKTDEQLITISTNLLGDYNFENIMAAIAIGLYFDVQPSEIRQAIEQYFPKNSRSQLVHTQKNTLFLDAYNANPTSMKAALLNFSASDSELPKAVILGDMLELGKTAKTEHLEILNLVNQQQYNYAIFVGEHFSQLATTKNNLIFRNTAEAARWLENNPIINHTILIKGSRGIALEKLLNLL